MTDANWEEAAEDLGEESEEEDNRERELEELNVLYEEEDDSRAGTATTRWLRGGVVVLFLLSYLFFFHGALASIVEIKGNTRARQREREAEGDWSLFFFFPLFTRRSLFSSTLLRSQSAASPLLFLGPRPSPRLLAARRLARLSRQDCISIRTYTRLSLSLYICL